jgi:hypothetical protein
MYFGSGVTKLNHAAKALRVNWEATEDGWRDQVRRDFEQRQIEPLLSQATLTIRAMEELSEIFGRIYRDCS